MPSSTQVAMAPVSHTTTLTQRACAWRCAAQWVGAAVGVLVSGYVSSRVGVKAVCVAVFFLCGLMRALVGALGTLQVAGRRASHLCSPIVLHREAPHLGRSHKRNEHTEGSVNTMSDLQLTNPGGSCTRRVGGCGDPHPAPRGADGDVGRGV